MPARTGAHSVRAERPHPSRRPSSRAFRAACVLSRASIFERIVLTWFFTVPSARKSFSAISLLLSPRASRPSTARSLPESGSTRCCCARGRGLRQPGKGVHHLARHGGLERRAAACDGPHGRCQLRAGDVLQQVAARARAHRLEDQLVLVEGRQHEDLRARRPTADPPRRLHAVHLRHADVHEHDVRCECLECLRRRPRRPRPPRRS